MKRQTECSIHGMETGWKMKARPTAHAMSHLRHLARGEPGNKCDMWWAGVFIPAQATHIVHCVTAINHRTAD